jgi:hypothetical protein
MASNVELLASQLQAAIAHLPPVYFSLVMATAIIATAAHLLALPLLAWPLLISLGAYAALWVLTLVRLFCYLPQVLADLTDHGCGPGFFTLVAATCLLGSTLLITGGAVGIARLLWFVGIGLWVVVIYAFFTVVVVREHKPTLETGINGAWLIATVATQSIAVLGALLAAHFDTARPLVLFGALCMYLPGCMLYLSIITLIFLPCHLCPPDHCSVDTPLLDQYGCSA